MLILKQLLLSNKPKQKGLYTNYNININMVKQTKTENKCNLCNYEWAGKENPKQCPRCKRYDWKK